MTSIVDICNRALSEIGARGEITSLSEASKEATTCRIHYESTLTGLLRAAHWGFARRQVALSTLGTMALGTAPFPWQFMYSYPPDCIRVRYLLWPPAVDANGVAIPLGDSLAYAPWNMPSRANRFLPANDATYGKVLLSNVENAIAVYTANITNPDHWDKSFDDAVVAALCAKLIIPLTGNAGMKTTFEQVARAVVTESRMTDGNEALPSTDHTPDWITARGTPSGYGFGTDLGMWYQGWDSSSWGA